MYLVRRALRPFGWGTLGAVLWLGAWWGTSWGLDREHSDLAFFVSNPAQVAAALIMALREPATWIHLASTAGFTVIGLLVAALLAIPTGLLMGRYRPVEGVLRPLVDMFRALPSAAVIPVAMLLLRSNGWDKTIAVVAFGSLWPMLVGTWDAVSSLPRQFTDTLKLLHLSEPRAVRLSARRVLGSVLTGVRVSAAISLILTVTIELYAPGEWERGVGRMIVRAQENYNPPAVYAALVLLMLLGYVLNSAMLGLVRLSGEGAARSAEEGMPAVRETPTSYLSDDLRDLPEHVLRVLTADQLTETLCEIYDPGGVDFEVLRSERREGVVERLVAFRVGADELPTVVGRSRISVDAIARELAERASSWEILEGAIEANSLGPALRQLLGPAIDYVEVRLTTLRAHAALPADVELAPGRIAIRERWVCRRGAREPLIIIWEYIAVDGLAQRMPGSSS